jgi:hypothetical protein
LIPPKKKREHSTEYALLQNNLFFPNKKEKEKRDVKGCAHENFINP